MDDFEFRRSRINDWAHETVDSAPEPYDYDLPPELPESWADVQAQEERQAREEDERLRRMEEKKMKHKNLPRAQRIKRAVGKCLCAGLPQPEYDSDSNPYLYDDEQPRMSTRNWHSKTKRHE